MPTVLVPDPLDLLPDPAVIHERIREAVRAERILRKLLSVSLAARRDRDAVGDRPAAKAALAG